MSAKGVVFKQWYRPRNRPRTATMNKKHLIYIATRPGAIYNPGCGFCLFGKTMAMAEAENINNLEKAKALIVDESHVSTMYRAVISLGHEDALEKGYYERSAWQKLICQKADVIAKETDIAPEHFNWMASYHHVKGHPHVHIIYWDGSDSIRQEHIPKERFEIMSEHIRAEFNREIYRDEIKLLQTAQSDQLQIIRGDLNDELAINLEHGISQKDLKDEMMAFLAHMGTAEPLSLSQITESDRTEVLQLFMGVCRELPKNGSLKYQYMPSEVKTLLDKTSDRILEVKGYRSKLDQYLATVQEVGRMYGNGEESIQFQCDRAMARIHKELGNELLGFIRDHKLPLLFKGERKQFEKHIHTRVLETLLNDYELREQYQAIYSLLPEEKPERKASIWTDDFRGSLSQLSEAIADVDDELSGHQEAVKTALTKVLFDQRDWDHRNYSVEHELVDSIQRTLPGHLLYKQLRAKSFKVKGDLQDNEDLMRSVKELAEHIDEPEEVRIAQHLALEKAEAIKRFLASQMKVKELIIGNADAHSFYLTLLNSIPHEPAPQKDFVDAAFEDRLESLSHLVIQLQDRERPKSSSKGTSEEDKEERAERMQSFLLKIMLSEAGWYYSAETLKAMQDILISSPDIANAYQRLFFLVPEAPVPSDNLWTNAFHGQMDTLVDLLIRRSPELRDRSGEIKAAAIFLLCDQRDWKQRNYLLKGTPMQTLIQKSIQSSIHCHLLYKELRGQIFKLKEPLHDTDFSKKINQLAFLSNTNSRQVFEMLQQEKEATFEKMAEYRNEVRQLIAGNLGISEVYEELVRLFPEQVTPRDEFMDDAFKEKLGQLTRMVFDYQEQPQDEKLSDKAREYKSRSIEEAILRMMAEDKQWYEAKSNYLVTNLLLSLFRAFSSDTNAQQARNRVRLKGLRGELSKQARRELAKEKSNTSLDWESPGL